MASTVPKLRCLAVKTVQASRQGLQLNHKRPMSVYTEAGAILPKPTQTSMSGIKLSLMVFPFMYAGATLSKSGAAFLEENDIFVPDDDDD